MRSTQLPFFVVLLGLAAACQQNSYAGSGSQDLAQVADFQTAAEATNVVLTLPEFERTPEEVTASVDDALAEADRLLDEFAAQDPAAVTFESTFAALDDILYPVATVTNRVWLMKETQQEAAMRDACTAAIERLNEWFVAVQYREDVYQVCREFEKAYLGGRADRLEGEDLKLFEDSMRNYRRAGFHLDAETRAEVADLFNEVNRLSTEFDTTITDAQMALTFTEEELDGVPESFLDAARQEDGTYKVRATVITDYLAVMENARSEDVRRRLNTARYSVAMEENGPRLNELVAVRDQIARKLGYRNWADYQIEPKMAGNGRAAIDFAERMVAKLQPKFRAEVEELRAMKAEETGDPSARIRFWDFRYYQNQLMKQKYQVDAEALRVYFELDRVLDGMLDVYAELFGLRYQRVEAPYQWVDDLRLYLVSDDQSGAPLGMFYLDLFPREGKYNHFAQFDIIGGKRLPDGRYQRPVAALVCNFTPGVGDEPSLMNHTEVETLFHEFGHAMHTILTQATYSSFAGANVPRDFVEAPSQMFEAWVWDPTVLQRFAVHYEDPADTIPVDVVARMKQADLATKGIYYRRQLALALSDLRLHTAGENVDAAQITNRVNADVLFPPPEGTNFAAYWGHLTGYDAGYYGYAWADAIAADMATAFEESPGGYLDTETGMRLRREIYEVGDSRPVDESIRAFLGRDRSLDPFIASLGVASN